MADDWRRRQQMAGGLLGGLSAAQLAAMGKHAATGQGKAWLPNWLYSRVHPGVEASTRAWWTGGRTPLGLRGAIMGARPTLPGTLGLAALTGLGSYYGTKGLLDVTGGTEHLERAGKKLYDVTRSDKKKKKKVKNRKRK
jgi:hypothetical protein